MHEIGVASQILKTALENAKKHNAEKILEINLEIGDLMLIKPNQLSFAFKAISKETIAQEAKLSIEMIKPEIRCRKCGYEGQVDFEEPESHLKTPDLKCPKCQSRSFQVLSGKECDVKNIKLEIPDV